ncbi:PREDICTED: centrosomal protein C10orf90 homolog isoform X2 [Chinchilla lanigera]|uniref:centrosomal protein C10orf90 homolog isoform X2 n=1 Tax=Chinchilla lanigera TaxID=34839 RepID=UPI0006981946|nr:PREDICTED: centrosomal protein C10orf90 homolog isoform X2 [Chinchilla lanigera]
MQHSGMPAKTQKGLTTGRTGTAVHRTFQIKTFSTELKNHVLVMDFVKSNWFPSQRRAKVCILHMCQGLKTAESPTSRHEIHSRFFSSTKDHSAWERNESLLNAGLQDNHYSTKDQICLRNLQSDVTERKSDFTKETLASQNTKMISSIVISQLIDENRSKDNVAALPLPCAVAQPRACRTKPASAHSSGVNIHRAFALLPDRLGIPTPSEEQGPEIDLPPSGDSVCGSPRQGFASITITARRVGPPAGAMLWGPAGDSFCPKCGAEDALRRSPSARAGAPHSRPRHGPLACTEFSKKGSVVRVKVPEAHARRCAGHEYWITHVDSKESSFTPDTPPSGKDPLMFTSCVRLRVSRQCPNSMCYLDKSLSVPVEQPQVVSPQMHRSVLSLNLSCSSHGLTADGVDGIANGEPINRARKQELIEGNQHLLGPPWNPALPESPSKENPSLGPERLETGTCPWSDCPPLENIEIADVGTNQVTVRKGKDHHATLPASGHGNQLSIHIPGWSYRAETKVFSGSSKKQQGEARVTLSAPPVEQKHIKRFLPDGDSSPNDGCLSSDLCKPTERRPPSFLRPRVTLPGFLCPLQDSYSSPQEDNGAQIKRELPKGDYTCCDLVVKIKECKKSEDSTMPEVSPALPSPTPLKGPETPGLSEDRPDPQEIPANPLTLQEALEVHKPQFISRSQERLKKLEHMVQQRKAQRKESLGQKQNLLPVRANKKQFTVPHPLSDNLFKPKERCISEKEMHMRSKRIYNNLPEVKKKKEEQKKRVILQSNRLRAEVFKKQLLDQLLQRNAV